MEMIAHLNRENTVEREGEGEKGRKGYRDGE
jgi:hypothetical protein